MITLKIWKKENDDILSSGSPHETLGFSKEKNYLEIPAFIQNYIIKKYEFNSIDQIADIKKKLLRRNVLIVNAENVLRNSGTLDGLKEAIEDIKTFLKKRGGSIGRIGDYYLILSPCSNIKIAN